MIEILGLISFFYLAVKYRVACEEQELRYFYSRRPWDLIQSVGNSDLAILALHGFGVSPQMFDSWAKQWLKHGWSYSIPMLTGSVGSIYAFEESNCLQWEQRALNAYDTLREQHKKVIIIGFSNGGLAALRVAQQRDPTAVILLAPFFGLAGFIGAFGDWLIERLRYCPAKIFIPNKGLDCSDSKGVEKVFRFRHSPLRAVLSLFQFKQKVIQGGRVPCKVFWSHSERDHVASYSKSLKLVHELASELDCLHLKQSYHYIMHDVESEQLELAVLNFIENNCIQIDRNSEELRS